VSTLLSNEVLKLRTVRGWWILLAATQALVLIGVTSKLLDAGTAGLADPDVPTEAVAHVGLASLFMLIFGITAVAGEYRHKTIADTYLASPHRGRVVRAKLYVYAALGLVSAVLGGVTALVELAVWFAARGVSLDLSGAALWRTLVGGILWNVVFAAIGVGIGALVRSLAGAIAVALAWVALVEGVVGELMGGARRWLPMNLGVSLGALPMNGSDTVSQWLAGTVLLGYTLVIAVVAVSLSVRRDVA
jgi:ABC-2 type transport system permease protein